MLGGGRAWKPRFAEVDLTFMRQDSGFPSESLKLRALDTVGRRGRVKNSQMEGLL